MCDHAMVVGTRRVGLSISQTADLLGFSVTTVSCKHLLSGSALLIKEVREEQLDWFEVARSLQYLK